MLVGDAPPVQFAGGEKIEITLYIQRRGTCIAAHQFEASPNAAQQMCSPLPRPIVYHVVPPLSEGVGEWIYDTQERLF